MSRNICLITYCHSHNYGVALQLFATYKKLKALGNQVTVLNYQNKFEASQQSTRFLFTNAEWKAKARYFLSTYVFGSGKNGKRNFSDFYRALHYTQPVSRMAEVEQMKDFDLFCVGSDQVWNPRITDGFDDVFTLNGKVAHKISYASSMGSLQFDGYDEKAFLRNLSAFDSISVRENSAFRYLQEHLSHPQPEQVVDPTLLYGKNGWDAAMRAANIAPLLSEKYVLVYALGGCFDLNNAVAHRIAEKINAKVAVITLSNRPKKVDYILNHATPLEFVSLIQHASFVVTNSFHGTCFSLLYERPFYSVRYGDNPARAEELLARYGLSGRLWREGDKINESALDNADIHQAQKNLRMDVIASEKWLEGAIHG